MSVRSVFALLVLTAGSSIVASNGHAQSATDAVTAGLLSRFEVVSENLVRAAEKIPEEDYGYRPTEDVRSLGELFTHVTAAHFGYCAAAAGESVPASARAPATGRAAIVENLRASRDFCLRAYRGVPGAALGESIDVFGSRDTRAGVLIQNVAHSNLHYGNVVTYMRELGIVPPSSE